jgi:hypothetical protein
MIFIKDNISIIDSTDSKLIEDLGMIFSSIAKNQGINKLDEIIKTSRKIVDKDYINDIKQKIIENFDKETAKILCKLL